MSVHLSFRTLCSSFFSSLSWRKGMPISLAFNFTVVRGRLNAAEDRAAEAPDNIRAFKRSASSSVQILYLTGLIARSLKQIQSVLGQSVPNAPRPDAPTCRAWSRASGSAWLSGPEALSDPIDKICTSAKLPASRLACLVAGGWRRAAGSPVSCSDCIPPRTSPGRRWGTGRSWVTAGRTRRSHSMRTDHASASALSASRLAFCAASRAPTARISAPRMRPPRLPLGFSCSCRAFQPAFRASCKCH